MKVRILEKQGKFYPQKYVDVEDNLVFSPHYRWEVPSERSWLGKWGQLHPASFFRRNMIKDLYTLKEVYQLMQDIVKHKKLYYSGQAKITDEQYDCIEDYLRELDPENPVLEMTGYGSSYEEKVDNWYDEKRELFD